MTVHGWNDFSAHNENNGRFRDVFMLLLQTKLSAAHRCFTCILPGTVNHTTNYWPGLHAWALFTIRVYTVMPSNNWGELPHACIHAWIRCSKTALTSRNNFSARPLWGKLDLGFYRNGTTYFWGLPVFQQDLLHPCISGPPCIPERNKKKRGWRTSSLNLITLIDWHLLLSHFLLCHH